MSRFVIMTILTQRSIVSFTGGYSEMPDSRLRTIFQRRLPDIVWQPIETPIARGIPDTNGILAGIEFWIEFKKAYGWRVRISPEQIAWTERRVRAGGRVFIAVRREATGDSDEQLFLFAGSQVRQLATGSFEHLIPLGRWWGRPQKWDWAAIRACLMQ